MNKLKELFQKIVFNYKKEITFYLTDRGFFSEINNLIFAIYYLEEKENKKIIIDTSYFTYKWSKENIFNNNYCFIEKDKRKIFKVYNKRKFYNSYIWKKIRDKKFQDNLFNEIEVEKIRKILEKFYVFKEKIDYEKDVPLEYVGLHIRRGDKVSGKWKEAEKIEVETYLSYIPENMKSLPLFVATDDEEVIEELRKLYGKDKIYTLFSKDIIRKNEKDFEKQSKEFIKKHTLLLLKEVEILTNSKCFIGSYSSNVGRFIALRRNFIDSYSVDVSWEKKY